MKTNVFFHGDCLFVMKHDIPPESIDLIYLDPPFYTRKKQMSKWDPSAMEISYDDDIWKDPQRIRDMKEHAPEWMIEIGNKSKERGAFAYYLYYMKERLRQCLHVLKSTGSIYLHCDWRASHYLKMVMDEVFGYENFRNEIVWYYKGGWKSNRWFARKHDIIFFYTKSSKYTFNMDDVLERFPDDVIKDHKRYPLKDKKGFYGIHHGKKYYMKETKRPDDVWDIPFIVPTSKERTGYATQKPLALLDRFINASSNKGDVVLDPFCGCGTAIMKAQELERKWIGIDIDEFDEAFKVIRKRSIQSNLIEPLEYSIIERTLDKVLDIKDKKGEKKGDTFERWVNGFYHAKKPSPDAGIDGITEDGILIQTKTWLINSGSLSEIIGKMDYKSLIPLVSGQRINVVSQTGFDEGAKRLVERINKEKDLAVELHTPKDMLKTAENLTR